MPQLFSSSVPQATVEEAGAAGRNDLCAVEKAAQNAQADSAKGGGLREMRCGGPRNPPVLLVLWVLQIGPEFGFSICAQASCKDRKIVYARFQPGS